MYFKDLEKIKEHTRTLVKIGWLDIDQPFNRGILPDGFIDKLKSVRTCKHQKGSHVCPFCENSKSSSSIRIRIGDYDYYDSPQMIIHYVEEHSYLPPQEYIDEVMKLKVEVKRPPTRINRFK